jgi:non-specific serine/threonine protein kinase
MCDSSTVRPYLEQHRALADRLARGAPADRGLASAYERGRRMRLEDALSLATSPAPLGIGRQAGLTPREQEVVALLGEGLSNQQVADRLVISVRTAQGHVERILRKLGFTSRSQVAAWVARGGG